MLLRWRVLLVVLICGTLFSSGLAQRTTAQTDTAQGLLDLPAMAPAPEELPAPGFSIWRGMLYTEQARAVSWAATDGRDVDTIVGALKAAGWLQSYETTYVVDDDEPEQTDHAVMLAVTEYADEVAATKQLSDELIPLSETVTDIPDAPAVGDASGARKLTNVAPPGVDTSTGVFQGIQLVFQADNLIARVMVMDRGDTSVDPALVASIGRTFLDHMQQVQTEGAPGLPGLVLRYEGAGEGTLEYYRRLDGVAHRHYGQAAGNNRLQTIDTYEYEPAFEDMSLTVDLATYADAESAGQAVDAIEQQFTTDLEEGMTAVTGGQSFGDASKTVSIDYQGVNIYVIAVRLGSQVVALTVVAVDIPLSVAENLMAAQLECVQTAACTEAVPLPAELSTPATPTL